MNKNFAIKGLADKNTLSDKLLKSMCIQTVSGTITSQYELEDLFEISITSSILNKSSLEFHDMNLNIFNCNFIFNVIGIDAYNKGMFFKYNINRTLTYESFSNIDSYNLIILDGFFNKESNLDITFSLVVALDFSKQNQLSNSQSNPLYNLNQCITSPEISLLFDKEFI